MTDETPEVKAAAERVRRVRAGARLSEVYGDDWWAGADAKLIGEFSRASHIDYMRLANAYLALFDPTPLSLDALTAELGEPNPNTLGVLYWSWTVSSREVTLRKDGLCCVASLDVTTLGELRRILSITTLGRSEKK